MDAFFRESGADDAEQTRIITVAYEAMGAISHGRSILARRATYSQYGCRIDDGHAHPDEGVPCIHCGLWSGPMPSVVRGVLVDLLDHADLDEEWNCKPARRPGHVMDRIEILPTDNEIILHNLYGPRWFDLLWVSTQLEQLAARQIVEFTQRLSVPTHPAPGLELVKYHGLAGRICDRIPRSVDAHARFLVEKRLARHLHEVDQGLLVGADLNTTPYSA